MNVRRPAVPPTGYLVATGAGQRRSPPTSATSVVCWVPSNDRFPGILGEALCCELVFLDPFSQCCNQLYSLSLRGVWALHLLASHQIRYLLSLSVVLLGKETGQIGGKRWRGFPFY